MSQEQKEQGGVLFEPFVSKVKYVTETSWNQGGSFHLGNVWLLSLPQDLQDFIVARGHAGGRTAIGILLISISQSIACTMQGNLVE